MTIPLPDRPAGSLAEALGAPGAPLGAVTVAGGDLGALIAVERDTAVLRDALARASRTGDRRWQIALAQRWLSLAPDDGLAAHLCGWLAEADRAAEAAALFAPLAPRLPPERAARLGTRIALAGGHVVREAEAVLGARFDIGRLLDTGWACLGAGAWDHLPLLLARGKAEAPGQGGVTALALQWQAVAEGPDAALAALIADPGPIGPGSALHAELRAQMLSALGRYSEALDGVVAAIARHPTVWSLYGLAEALAAQADRSDTLEALIETASRLFPGQPEILARAVNLAADTARRDAAEVLLPRLRAVSDWGYHEARIGLLCQTGDAGAIAAAHAEAQAAGLPPGSAELTIAGHHYFFDARGDALARAEALVAPLARRFSHDAGYQCLRLRLMLAQGREAAALAAHAALPPGLRGAAQLAPFGLLSDVRAGREAAARAGWTRHLARSGHIALNARSAYPEQVTLRWGGGADDILLFAVVFNGIEYVDWLLDHYRRLGVDHFFFVDNGSTDGTFDALAAQPDVSLFRQQESFRAAGCGIFWINHLIRRFGVGHWCFQVDMDEAFVFPHMDRGRHLRDFLGYVAEQGWASVPAMMLDIYPEALGDSPASFADSRHFDVDYHAFPNELPPYSFIQGGIRARLSGRSLMMTKAPLVRPGPDFAYLANNHQHTHLPVAEVTGALLHYKFVGDMRGRIDEAIAREEHFMGARFYRALRDPLSPSGAATPLTSEHSRVYGGPDDLVRAGLMTSRADWDGWVARDP